MLAALRARQEALEETLKQRIEELKSICIREAVWTNMHCFNARNQQPCLLAGSFKPKISLCLLCRSWQESFPRNILSIPERSRQQSDGKSALLSNWTSRKFFPKERWVFVLSKVANPQCWNKKKIPNLMLIAPLCACLYFDFVLICLDGEQSAATDCLNFVRGVLQLPFCATSSFSTSRTSKNSLAAFSPQEVMIVGSCVCLDMHWQCVCLGVCLCVLLRLCTEKIQNWL